MKLLAQPIPTTFTTLKKHNPTQTLRHSRDTIWLRTNDSWLAIATTPRNKQGQEQQPVLMEKGDRLLSVDHATFEKVYAKECRA